MSKFEITIKDQSFRISRNKPDRYSFNVFNHATFHVLEKDEHGVWKDIEHRFGDEILPVNEIGEAIDQFYKLQA